MAERYFYGLGRHKTSTAQVRLYSDGVGVVVNGQPVEKYFSRQFDILRLMQPLTVAALTEKFRVSVKVQGGGVSGQAGAIRLGIARALLVASPELRPVLKKAGFLTRDPRVKERKKPGLKRARKAPQYTKR